MTWCATSLTEIREGFISSLFPFHLFCFVFRCLETFLLHFRTSLFCYLTGVILIRYLQVWRKQDNTWTIFIYNSTTTTVTRALDNGSQTL